MTKRTTTAQYTIRGLPDSVDRAIRERARREGCSLNEVALEALRASVSMGGESLNQDPEDLIGTWEVDPGFDAAIREQDQVDEALWS